VIPHRDPRDGTLVSVLAYAGVHRQEAFALRRRSIGERTLLVEEAVAQGGLKGQKTNRPPRGLEGMVPHDLRHSFASLLVHESAGSAFWHSPVMGDPGLEPGTSSLSEKRSNRLS
jgi:integrase